MSKHTLEQVLEALINKEDDRASELLHQFFVAKGKSIYEELSQFDEEMDESIGGSPKDDFEDEIIADEAELDDESLFSEAEDEMEDPMAADEEPTEPEADMDLAADDDSMNNMGGSAEDKVEQAMDNAEDAFAELKAAFAEIMGEEPDADNMGGESDHDADNMDMEEPTEEGYNAFGESVSLKAVSKPTPGEDGENKKSPVSSGTKISGNGAKAVKITDGNTAGGTTPSSKEINSGNVNKVGNAKAPALRGVSTPKNSDSASNKTSPVAK